MQGKKLWETGPFVQREVRQETAGSNKRFPVQRYAGEVDSVSATKFPNDDSPDFSR